MVHAANSAETDKWEVIWVPRRRLDQELVPPTVERVEALGVIDVVYEDAAVGSPVEGDA